MSYLMNSAELYKFANEILREFQKSLNEVEALSGYVYNRQAINRRMNAYLEDLIQSFVEKFKIFQKEYTTRLNFVCDAALREMTFRERKARPSPAKIRLWKKIYNNQPAEFIMEKYLDALNVKNRDFIYFVENEFFRTRNFSDQAEQFQELIQKNRKLRVRHETEEEIRELRSLYAFYIKSLEFSKYTYMDLHYLESLYSSLNRKIAAPVDTVLKD
ncbi:MAG: hypothetical protein P8Y60_05165 [Calditrichota bacterium]